MYTDNRDLSEVISYLEARIEAQKNRIKELLAELGRQHEIKQTARFEVHEGRTRPHRTKNDTRRIS